MSAIEIKNLYFKYKGLTIFNDLNFSLKYGESILIAGKSGVGKSTLINLIFGLLYPNDGEIIVMNQSIYSRTKDELAFMRRNIGYIEQFSDLLPSFNVVENVMMPLMIENIPYSDAFDRAVELLEKVDLENQLYQNINTLSGGQKKRVAIARCLINNPKLILADEACTNLDYENSKNIVELLKHCQEENGTAIIWVNHEDDKWFNYSQIITLT